MGGDSERAAEPKDVNGMRRADKFDRPHEVLFAHAVLQAFQRDHAFRGKPRQHRTRIARVVKPAVAPQAGDALLVGGRNARDEPRSKDLLHLGEAAIAHRARKSHDG
jgi:hypothetical protein